MYIYIHTAYMWSLHGCYVCYVYMYKYIVGREYCQWCIRVVLFTINVLNCVSSIILGGTY